MYGLFLLGLIAPTAFAVAVPNARDASCTYTAKFDELEAPFGGLSDLKNEIPTPYHGLAYANYHVAGLGEPSWQSPHSPPNTIFYNFFQQASVGQPAITSAYPGSTVSSFDAQSFYYSCIYPNPLPIYVPTNCTIQARGTRPDGSVVVQEFEYVVPAEPLRNEPQTLGVFSGDFRGIQTLEWVASPTIFNLSEVFPAFDDFTYRLHGSAQC